MKTDEAIKFLAKKGIHVDRINKNSFRIWDDAGPLRENWTGKSWMQLKDPANYNWTGREVIKMARWHKDSDQQTTIHKSLKQDSRNKNRTATRDALKTESFDKIPDKNSPVKTGNIWDWD